LNDGVTKSCLCSGKLSDWISSLPTINLLSVDRERPRHESIRIAYTLLNGSASRLSLPAALQKLVECPAVGRSRDPSQVTRS
jgi:hypothetical protein